MCTVDLLVKSPDMCVATLSNGEYVLKVIKDVDYLVAVSMTHTINGEKFVPIAKRAVHGTYDDFYKLVGKLAMKDVTSKYFANPKYEEHLVNGNVSKADLNDLRRTIDYIDQGGCVKHVES